LIFSGCRGKKNFVASRWVFMQAVRAREQCDHTLSVQVNQEISCQTLDRFAEKGLLAEDLDRLQKTLPIVYPWNAGYDRLRLTYNRLYCNIFVMGIMVCKTVEDVQKALKFVLQYQLSFVLRSGRHNSLTYSVEADIIIDVFQLSTIRVQGNRVIVGPGARNGPIFEALSPYKLILPTGSCRNVCVGGLTAGGGISPFLVRSGGMTCDRAISFQVVLADGRVVKASAHHHPDLFFALRGAGNNNFGIITEIAYEALPFTGAWGFDIRFQFHLLRKVVTMWQAFAPFTDNRISSELELFSPRTLPLPVVFRGQINGPLNLISLLQPFIDLATSPCNFQDVPETNSYRICGFDLDLYAKTSAQSTSSYRVEKAPSDNDPTCLYLHEMKLGEGRVKPEFRDCVDRIETKRPIVVEIRSLPEVVDVGLFWGLTVQTYFTDSSIFWNHPMNEGAIQTLIHFLEIAPGPLANIEMNAMRGAVSDLKPEDTAFPYRGALFWTLLRGRAFDYSDYIPEGVWVKEFYDRLAPFAKLPDGNVPSYVNIVQANLRQDQRYLKAYYDTNVERLQKIKRKYDPHNVFHYPQSIPLAR
jgi:hypothetical protein